MQIRKLQLFPYCIQELFQIKFSLISCLEEPVKVNAVKHPQASPELLHLPPEHLCSPLRFEVAPNEPSVESLHKIVLVEVVKDQCVKGVAQENYEPKYLEENERNLKGDLLLVPCTDRHDYQPCHWEDEQGELATKI